MSKSLLRTQTIEYEGGTITVQSSSILSLINRDDVKERLGKVIERGENYLATFADLVAQTTVFKGFGFTLPPSSASAEDLLAALEQYIQLPLDLVDSWIAMVRAINAPPGTKPELQPGATSEDPKLTGQEESNSDT